jgi:hypothetical protein
MGKIGYIADKTRQDLLYPVNYLSRFMHKPSKAVQREIKRLLEYLNLTINDELILGGLELLLFAMTDASFLHIDGCRSQLAYLIFLGRGGAISVYSKRSPTVALSSTQSETDALVECHKELLWFVGFLLSIGIQANPGLC